MPGGSSGVARRSTRSSSKVSLRFARKSANAHLGRPVQHTCQRRPAEIPRNFAPSSGVARRSA
eukprot:8019993-Alexandrium_andersonii.AAC.1